MSTPHNHTAWEREYTRGLLVTKHTEPQPVVKAFCKWAKKNASCKLGPDVRVLDLGCGTGRNALYAASKGAVAIGYDISSTAIQIAKTRASETDDPTRTHFVTKSIGTPFNEISDASINMIFDITASHALTEAERDVFIQECTRVLAPGGVMMVRGLCLDGDNNAKKLIKTNPGPEANTYIMPGTGLIERVFTMEEAKKKFSKIGTIASAKKTESYSKINGTSYKRSFFILYIQKPNIN
jgi:cyclopropane fatty-acyl-phospholipid synthase-like methyltransferase